jgi:hypothetical protein
VQTRCQEKEKPPLTSPAPKANGGILGEVRGTSIDMTLDIVGITEMQKCGLKYVIHTPCGLLDICNKKAEPKLRQVSLGNE